jgi:hypothetical protein
MRFRKLRIAWSVGWGFLCVLIILLCVRSYWVWDSVLIPMSQRRPLAIGRSPELRSSYGQLIFYGPFSHVFAYPLVLIPQQPLDPLKYPRAPAFLGFNFRQFGGAGQWALSIPHWFAVMVLATLAAAPWIRKLKWRFSLRTLLIATTLLAMVLGLIVYAAR